MSSEKKYNLLIGCETAMEFQVLKNRVFKPLRLQEAADASYDFRVHELFLAANLLGQICPSVKTCPPGFEETVPDFLRLRCQRALLLMGLQEPNVSSNIDDYVRSLFKKLSVHDVPALGFWARNDHCKVPWLTFDPDNHFGDCDLAFWGAVLSAVSRDATLAEKEDQLFRGIIDCFRVQQENGSVSIGSEIAIFRTATANVEDPCISREGISHANNNQHS